MEESNKKHYPIVRTIYLYIFTLLGLLFLTIGGIRFIDMGLKAFVFTKAEEEQRLIHKQPPMLFSIPGETDVQQDIEEGKEVCFSEEQKKDVERWLADYNFWKEGRAKIDYVASKRHKDASFNLAMMLIGLPLYLYHWRIIKRETKNRENA